MSESLKNIVRKTNAKEFIKEISALSKEDLKIMTTLHEIDGWKIGLVESELDDRKHQESLAQSKRNTILSAIISGVVSAVATSLIGWHLTQESMHNEGTKSTKNPNEATSNTTSPAPLKPVK